MDVHVIATDWQTHGPAMRRVREIVFIEEQGVPRDEEWDDNDELAHHFIAIDSAGRTLGTARLLRSGQIGRMAVLEPHRHRGLGRRLLDAAIEAAKSLGMESVFLHAQVQALDFYRKAGFEALGDEFTEAGIPHREMRLLLPMAFDTTSADRSLDIHNPNGPGMEGAPRADDHPPRLITFVHESTCREALELILGNAKRSLDIMSNRLDNALFGTPTAVDIISRFARRAAVPRVRVLVEDVRAVAEGGHHLLELARRLPSKVEIRRMPPDVPEGMPRQFVIADGEGIWVVPEPDALTGFANPHDRVEARRLTETFNRLFDRATDDPELRRLTL